MEYPQAYMYVKQSLPEGRLSCIFCLSITSLSKITCLSNFVTFNLYSFCYCTLSSSVEVVTPKSAYFEFCQVWTILAYFQIFITFWLIFKFLGQLKYIFYISYIYSYILKVGSF